MRRTMRLAVVLATLSTTVLIGVAPAGAGGNGATQVSGSTTAAVCNEGPGDWAEAHYSFGIEGDLNGCVYGLVTWDHCTPSGMYQERANEIFVDNDGDSFEMTEFFWAKYVFGEVCNFDTVEAQIFGGCKHPIVNGSGSGKYDGISGRLDFKDDVETGIAHYKGHVKGVSL